MRTQQTQSSGDSVSQTKTRHRSVLLQEVIDLLEISPGDVVFDGTLGGAGHAKAIVERLDESGVFIGTDLNSEAINLAKDVLKNAKPRIILSHTNFKNIRKVCEENNIDRLDKVILDLGWSSDQMRDESKGLSFLKDGPLDMRMSDSCDLKYDDRSYEITAKDIVNQWAQDSIEDILRGWGDERYAARIAKGIIEARRGREINTTFELVEIIKKSTPRNYHRKRIHFATRTFQALRIAVNNEMENLRTALEEIVQILAKGGRVAVISFHSTEDRIVKNTFKSWKRANVGESITKKPITPKEEEIKSNRRSRSAKLRVFYKYKNDKEE